MELGRDVWTLMHAEAHLSVEGAAVVWLAFHLNVLFVLRNRQLDRRSLPLFVLSINPLFFPPLVPHHSFTAHTPLYFFRQRCFCTILSRQSRLQFLSKPRPSISAALQSKSGGLAQVITQCTVPGTVAPTFDDVRALLLAYPIYIY